uniref:Uncharacterized protein n=1 Tax=Romanomermis culicivorax TaxID=13658 RepID=A0A915IA64_ROMCU
MMCDFLANDPRHPGIYGLDAEFMNHHMDWVDWDKKEAGPLANLTKRKLDIALYGQQYSEGPFAVIIQICRADGHTVIFDLLEMGVIPISLIDLLKSAREIIGFAANCVLTAMANVDIRFADERQLPTSSSDSTKRNWGEKTSAKSLKPQPKKTKPDPSQRHSRSRRKPKIPTNNDRNAKYFQTEAAAARL